MKYIKCIILAWLVTTLFCCKDEINSNGKKKQNSSNLESIKTKIKINYQIILDLSDRLLKNPNQSQRDKEIIYGIIDIFDKKIKQELFIKNKDIINIHIAHQNNVPYQPWLNSNLKYFTINMTEIPIKKKKYAKQRSDNLKSIVDSLYSKAVYSNDPNQYQGANLFNFFKDQLANYLLLDTSYVNIVVILTDGTHYVKDLDLNDKQLWRNVNIPANSHTYILEVQKNTNDPESFDKISTWWKEHLEWAGVESVEVYPNDIAENIIISKLSHIAGILFKNTNNYIQPENNKPSDSILSKTTKNVIDNNPLQPTKLLPNKQPVEGKSNLGKWKTHQSGLYSGIINGHPIRVYIVVTNVGVKYTIPEYGNKYENVFAKYKATNGSYIIEPLGEATITEFNFENILIINKEDTLRLLVK